MDLLYGTNNQAKLENMRRVIRDLPLTIHSLKEYPDVGEPSEVGNTPLENARAKAWHYYRAYGAPCFSCDSGLYIDNLPQSLQPGVHVRRVGDKYLNDEEMIAYYASLAKRFGRLKAQYRNGICLILDENHVLEQFDDTLGGEPFYITDTPHVKRIKGFPLDSVSVMADGTYYLDAQVKVDEPDEKSGFYAFFQRVLTQG